MRGAGGAGIALPLLDARQIRRASGIAVLISLTGRAGFFGRDDYALAAPGLSSADLFDARPWLDVNLVHGAGEVAALVARDRSLAVLYLPRRRPVTVSMLRLGYGRTGKDILVHWLDPTSGERRKAPPARQALQKHEKPGLQTFEPPARNDAGGEDHVLVFELREWPLAPGAEGP